MWYVVNGLKLTNLKNHISKKLNNYKSYKQCFNHIEEEWEKTHYMDSEYADQIQNSNEVSKIQEREDIPIEDPQEQAFQAEVNRVFQKYGRQYTNNQPWYQRPSGFRFQGSRSNYNRNTRFTGNHFSSL